MILLRIYRHLLTVAWMEPATNWHRLISPYTKRILTIILAYVWRGVLTDESRIKHWPWLLSGRDRRNQCIPCTDTARLSSSLVQPVYAAHCHKIAGARHLEKHTLATGSIPNHTQLKQQTGASHKTVIALLKVLYILAVRIDRLCSLIMAALCNRAGHYIFARSFLSSFFLWSPYVIGQTIIFSSCFFLLSSSFFLFFPRLISAVEDWMFTILWHMVWP